MDDLNDIVVGAVKILLDQVNDLNHKVEYLMNQTVSRGEMTYPEYLEKQEELK